MIFNLKRPGFNRGAWNFVPASGDTPPEWDTAGADWMMAIPVSGTLTLTVGIIHADLCLVAAGKPGNDDDGGDGGQLVNITDVTLPAGVYTVTVGVSGSDTVLTAPDGRSWTAQSGAGAAHGRPGGDGDLAWDDPDTLLRPGWIYGSGGGRGEIRDNNYTHYDFYPGGSIGTADTATTWGQGGTFSHMDGYPGFPGTGQAGGGRARYWNGSRYVSGTPGVGGSGSVLIRNHKEVTA